MYAGERGYFGSVAEGVFLPSEILNRLGTGTQTRCHSGSRDQASPRAFSPDLLTGKTEERESCVPTVNNSEMAPYFALASPTSPTLALGARLLLRPSPDVSSPSCRSDISRWQPDSRRRSPPHDGMLVFDQWRRSEVPR